MRRIKAVGNQYFERFFESGNTSSSLVLTTASTDSSADVALQSLKSTLLPKNSEANVEAVSVKTNLSRHT